MKETKPIQRPNWAEENMKKKRRRHIIILEFMVIYKTLCGKPLQFQYVIGLLISLIKNNNTLGIVFSLFPSFFDYYIGTAVIFFL